MNWENKEILILVKAYPEQSKKYGTSVCTAGLTNQDKDWIRIYPIRLITYGINKFLKKWIRIRAEVKPSNERLRRLESYKIKENSIEIINDELISTQPRGNWKKRHRIMNRHISDSIKVLDQRKEFNKISLGLIKPKDFEFYFRTPVDQIEIKQNKSIQKTLDGEDAFMLDQIPNAFAYKFHCGAKDCNGHDMICEDWEIRESFRSWRKRYTHQELANKMLDRYNKWMHKKRELYFILGTTNRFNTWVIIGLYYPPKNVVRGVSQENSLDKFF